MIGTKMTRAGIEAGPARRRWKVWDDAGGLLPVFVALALWAWVLAGVLARGGGLPGDERGRAADLESTNAGQIVDGHMRTMLLGALAASLMGCADDRSGVCTAVATAGLSVSVTNAATAGAICDATVTASDGSSSEVLILASCTFVGAFERPGTYVVRVEHSGFVAKEINQVTVVMGTGTCPHVQEVRLAVSLSPDE